VGRDRGANAVENRCPLRDGAAPTLPLDGPAPRLAPDVVGGRAGHEDQPRICGQRQHILILEQHQRTLHRSARQRPVRRAADQGEILFCGQGLLEQPLLELDAQDAAHRVVDAFLAHVAPLDGLGERGR
jgi:hypothetical protein